MKKILATILVSAACLSAYAQGTVVFANNAATLVTLQGGGAAPTDGSFTVTLWFSSTLGGSLTQLGTAPLGILSGNPVAGRFNGGTLTTPDVANGGIAAGGNGYFQVSVAGSLSGVAYTGQSALLFRPTGGGLIPAQNLTSVPNPNPNGYTALAPITLVPVPEPAVVTLALVGAGILMFRRRKA